MAKQSDTAIQDAGGDAAAQHEDGQDAAKRHEDAQVEKSSKNRRGTNLLTHGAYSTLFLAGEEKDEHDRLQRAVYEEWSIEGPTEKAHADGLTRWIWAESRVSKWLEQTIEAAASEETIQSGLSPEVKALIARIEAATDDSELLEAWGSASKLLGYQLKVKLPRSGTGDPVKVKSALLDALTTAAAPRTSSEPTVPDLEQLLKLLERIGANRARENKSLVQTKAMKQMISRVRGDRSADPGQKVIAAPTESGQPSEEIVQTPDRTQKKA